MKAIEGFIHVGNSKVRCVKYGEGGKLLLAIHGFGQDAGVFREIAEGLQHQYTTIAIDLPFHGRTDWKEPYLETAGLMALVQGFKNNMQVKKLSLLGFSLGGRVCLHILEKQASWIEELFLLAPEGLTKGRWYRLATSNFLGRKIFNSICRNPKPLLQIVSGMQRLGWLKEPLVRFINKNMSDGQNRALVHAVWHNLSKLKTHRVIVHYFLKKQQIPLHIIMGKQDAVSPPSLAEAYVKGYAQGYVHTLPYGHNLLKASKDIVQVILSSSV